MEKEKCHYILRIKIAYFVDLCIKIVFNYYVNKWKAWRTNGYKNKT